jgi:hypothetical protein
MITAFAEAARYYPALDQGKAVEGVARLIMTQLAL